MAVTVLYVTYSLHSGPCVVWFKRSLERRTESVQTTGSHTSSSRVMVPVMAGVCRFMMPSGHAALIEAMKVECRV